MADIIAGAIVLAVSALFFAATFAFPRLTIALSPALFPRFVTVCLMVLSGALLVRAASRRPIKAAGGRSLATQMSHPPAFALRFASLAAVVLLYVAFLEPVGYVLVTPPLIAAAMLIFGDRNGRRIAMAAVFGAAVLYAVFRLIFRVPLPRSALL